MEEAGAASRGAGGPTTVGRVGRLLGPAMPAWEEGGSAMAPGRGGTDGVKQVKLLDSRDEEEEVAKVEAGVSGYQ